MRGPCKEILANHKENAGAPVQRPAGLRSESWGTAPVLLRSPYVALPHPCPPGLKNRRVLACHRASFPCCPGKPFSRRGGKHRASVAGTALTRAGRAAGAPPAGRAGPAGKRRCCSGLAVLRSGRGRSGRTWWRGLPDRIPRPRRPRRASMWAASRGAASLEASMAWPATWWPLLAHHNHPLLVWFPCWELWQQGG